MKLANFALLIANFKLNTFYTLRSLPQSSSLDLL